MDSRCTVCGTMLYSGDSIVTWGPVCSKHAIKLTRLSPKSYYYQSKGRTFLIYKFPKDNKGNCYELSEEIDWGYEKTLDFPRLIDLKSYLIAILNGIEDDRSILRLNKVDQKVLERRDGRLPCPECESRGPHLWLEGEGPNSHWECVECCQAFYTREAGD